MAWQIIGTIPGLTLRTIAPRVVPGAHLASAKTREVHMPSAADVPYADPEPLSEQVEECRCVESECAAHGVNLHPDHHEPRRVPTAPVNIDDATQHMMDDLSDYGA